jgi:MFS family permease
MTSKFTELAIDCADPSGLARFWCSVLDYEVQDEDDGIVTIGSPMVPEGKNHLGPVPPTLTFAHVPDATIVNIALPSAQQALGFANSDRQWVVTAYALAFGSLLLVGGRLGDMYSRKWVLITGLIGFAVASAIGGAAVSFVMLVSARALQGAFGANLAPSALGTLVSTFRNPLERGRAFAVFGSVAVGGGAVGLILGGVLTQYLSWRYTLFVNLIFAAIAVAGALVYIRSSRPASPPRMDWPGAVLACAGLFLIVFGFSRAETAGWTAPLSLGSLVLGAVLLTAFVVAEQRSSHPLLPLRVIIDRTRGGSYVAVGITGIALFAIFLFLTFYMQQVKGYSPLTTGLLFLPLVAGILVASTLYSVVLLPRVGPRALVTAGMLLSAGGAAYLAQLTVTSSYLAGVLPPAHHGPGLRLDLRVGGQLGHGRRPTPGLRRGLGAGQHDAAGWRIDRHLRPQHHHGERDDQLPHRPPHRPAGTSDRGDPRLHPGLHDLGRTARARRDPCDPHAALTEAA